MLYSSKAVSLGRGERTNFVDASNTPGPAAYPTQFKNYGPWTDFYNADDVNAEMIASPLAR